MRQVPKLTILDFKKKKSSQIPISVLTCYDYPSAKTIAQTPIDCVLVGDSVAMAVHGHESTITATIDMMVLHTQAVAKGLGHQFLVADMPFLAHKESSSKTIQSVRALMQAGAQAVKIEGADESTCQTIRYLVDSGVPVMGHIGLTPRSLHQLGGYKVQGRGETGNELQKAAFRLQAAGCFALVIECAPEALSQLITESLEIPTIGIGAGRYTDGQVLVWHDMLGLQHHFTPQFLKRFMNAESFFIDAITDYDLDVKERRFPAREHCFEPQDEVVAL